MLCNATQNYVEMLIMSKTVGQYFGIFLKEEFMKCNQ